MEAMKINDSSIKLDGIDKSNWRSYRFDEIAKNISERVDPGTTDLKVYVGLEHIDSESLYIKRFGTPNDVKGQKLKFYKGDIIFGRRRAYQRKAGIAACDGFCSAHALVLRANPDVINPKLFPFFLHSDAFMNRAVDISVGSLSPTINWGTLKHQEFVLPPQSIQDDLSELFDFSYDLVQKQNRLLERLEALKQSKLRSSFSKDACEKVRISDVSDNLDNKRIPIKKSNRTSGDYPYYGASGIVDYVSEYIFDEPVLLISEDGENLNSRKLPIAYEVDEKCWVNNHAHVLRITNGCRYLIAEYLNSHDLSDYITGGTRPKITKGMLGDIQIYQPQKDMIPQVRKELRLIDKVVSDTKEKTEANRKLLKVLQNQVF